MANNEWMHTVVRALSFRMHKVLQLPVWDDYWMQPGVVPTVDSQWAVVAARRVPYDNPMSRLQ